MESKYFICKFSSYYYAYIVEKFNMHVLANKNKTNQLHKHPLVLGKDNIRRNSKSTI